MYTKLFSHITESTVWQEDDHTRIVWITMLAMSDREGYVRASIPGLAGRARVPLVSVESALEKLSSPDKYSQTQEHEGRRIERLEGGWFILNYTKYRDMQRAEERREYMREYQRDRRAGVKKVNRQKFTVNNVNTSDADTDAKDGKGGGSVYSSSPTVDEQGNTRVNPSPPPINPQQNSQSDFDERDHRILAKAKKVILKRVQAAVGSESVTEAQFMTAVCEESGLPPQRVKKLEDMLKWRE